MKKRWNFKQRYDDALATQLANELKLDVVFAQLLLQRGIKTAEEANAFFNPDVNHLHDPMLLKDMDKAVERILEAIQKRERILIYGDYDVDGTTAVALVYSFLKPNYDEELLDFYIPDRYNEGYGVSIKGIDDAKSKGVGLIITLDCGIKAVEKVAYAKSLGIDVIICDHHTPGDQLPNAVACIDPKRDDCEYPDKNLSGCGVGYKLMQALCKRGNMNKDDLETHLDLVAVSIASDIVPITGENRILAFHGLKQLNEKPSIGLQAIINEVRQGKTADKHSKYGADKAEVRGITISDIVFKIGPRINAAGRVKSGSDAVRLLLSTNSAMAKEMSTSIEESNDRRKDLDQKITTEALAMIESDEEMLKRKSTVLFNESWHKGVIGIVASRLTETYYRPTIVLTMSNGLASGSARSVDGFDLYKAIDSCSDLLENFGGHMYAAGLTMKRENVEEFTRRFELYVSENIDPEQLTPQVEVDSELMLSSINDDFYKTITRFEPFGPGNTRPVFVSNNVYDYGTSKQIGRDKSHLRLEMIQDSGRDIKKGIAFGKGAVYEQIKDHKPFSICYTIEENEFPKGHKNLQLMVRDIHFE